MSIDTSNGVNVWRKLPAVRAVGADNSAFLFVWDCPFDPMLIRGGNFLKPTPDVCVAHCASEAIDVIRGSDPEHAESLIRQVCPGYGFRGVPHQVLVGGATPESDVEEIRRELWNVLTLLRIVRPHDLDICGTGCVEMDKVTFMFE